MGTFHVVANAEGTLVRPRVEQIGVLDVIDALRRGWNDFREKPSHYVFLCLLYPVAGVVLMVWSAGANLLPLMFPLASGRLLRSGSTRSAAGVNWASICPGGVRSTSGIHRQCFRSWPREPRFSCCSSPG